MKCLKCLSPFLVVLIGVLILTLSINSTTKNGHGVAHADEFQSTPYQRPSEPQPSTESPQVPAMDVLNNSLGPMMEKLTASTIKTSFASIAQKDVAENLAAFQKNYMEALMAKGFTREEAMKIVVSVGFPVLPSIR